MTFCLPTESHLELTGASFTWGSKSMKTCRSRKAITRDDGEIQLESGDRSEKREQTKESTRSHSNTQVKSYKEKRWTRDSPATLHNPDTRRGLTI